MTIRDHLQPSPSHIEGENMAVSETEGYQPDGTEIRRKVPLKKRKREYSGFASPEGSSSHDESTLSITRDPSDRRPSSQPSSGAPSPANLPQHDCNPAAMSSQSHSTERIPVKKRPSFQERRQEKTIQEQAMENGSVNGESDSGASCSFAVDDSDDEKLQQSPEPLARIDFFKKRGRKLPKALRLRKLNSGDSEGNKPGKPGKVTNSAASSVRSFETENRVTTKSPSQMIGMDLPSSDRSINEMQQSENLTFQSKVKSSGGSQSSDFASHSKQKKKTKGLLSIKEKHSVERARMVSRDAETSSPSHQDKRDFQKKVSSKGSKSGSASYHESGTTTSRKTDNTRISREPSDSDHGEDPTRRLEDSDRFRGMVSSLREGTNGELIKSHPSDETRSAAEEEDGRLESNQRVSKKKKKKKHRRSEGSNDAPVSDSRPQHINSESTPSPTDKTQQKESPQREVAADNIPKASAPNNSPRNELSDSDDSDSDEEQNFWIQCDACKKWRIIPAHMSGWLPDIWHCDENLWDTKRASCSVPQQELEEDEYHIGGNKNGFKKKKNRDKKREKLVRRGTPKTADGVQKRPRGRPPLGKVWDCAKGMYVPKGELSVEAQSISADSAAFSPNPASLKSDKSVQKSSEKKRKNKASDSPSAKRKKTPGNGGGATTLADYNTRDQKQLEKLLAIGRREARAELEREKERVMKRLPQSVKNLFGQVGFARWGAQCLPALCLDPYKVPPGAAREAWMSMFKKVRKSGRVLNDINILVHWYGEQHPDNLFSLLEIDKFIPYHESTHEMRCYDKAAKKKLKLQKKLTRHDQQRIRAMDELHLDLQKRPSERQPVEFKERDELLTIADVVEYLDEESDESESEPIAIKRQPSEGGYSTLEDSDDDLEAEQSPITKPNTTNKSLSVDKSRSIAIKEEPGNHVFASESTALPSYSRSKESRRSQSESNDRKKSNRVSPFQSSPLQSSPESRPAGWGSSSKDVANDAKGLPASPKSSKFKKAKVGKKGKDDKVNNDDMIPNATTSQSLTESDRAAIEGLPDDSELDNMRVDDLVQRIFMQAKGRAEGSALMGTVIHVVNRLREQRDAALQQVAALSVERANLLAVLQGGEVITDSKKK